MVIDRAIGEGSYRRYEFDGVKIVAAWPVDNFGGRKIEEAEVVRPSSLKGEARKAWLAALKEFDGKSFNWESTEPVVAPKGFTVELRQASRLGNFAKPFVARISGADAKFRFSRSFLSAESEVSGGQWVFRIAADGIYHCCDRNSKGAKREWFVRVVNGSCESITAEELDAIFPAIEVEATVAATGNQRCAACGRTGHLIEDLEDGLLKHPGCCDMPSGFSGGGNFSEKLDDFTS